MPGKDIFLSYAREDRDRILPLVRALESTGWTVFWDSTIPTGRTWRQVISEELSGCRSMVVAWSKASVEKEWVLSEAERGKKRKILFPVCIDRDVELPLVFDQIQTTDLVGWGGSPSALPFERLVKALSSLLGPPPADAERDRQEQEKVARRIEEIRQRAQEADRKAQREVRQRLASEEAARKAEEGKRRQAEEEAALTAERKRLRQAEAAATSQPAYLGLPPPPIGGVDYTASRWQMMRFCLRVQLASAFLAAGVGPLALWTQSDAVVGVLVVLVFVLLLAGLAVGTFNEGRDPKHPLYDRRQVRDQGLYLPIGLGLLVAAALAFVVETERSPLQVTAVVVLVVSFLGSLAALFLRGRALLRRWRAT